MLRLLVSVIPMASISTYVKQEEGSRLRSAYQRLKLRQRITQADVAIACGWKNASTFNRLLLGKLALTLESVERLAPVLGVTPEYLSPRLLHATAAATGAALALPVGIVRSVTKGCWGEPFMTELQVHHHTSDPSAFALVFDASCTPPVFGRWVLILEPATAPQAEDWVVVKQAKGKYAYAQVVSVGESSVASLRFEGGDLQDMPLSRCSLVACLMRPAAMRNFRACAEK